MKMRTKKRKKLLTNNKEHIKRKQNTILQFETLIHYRNRRIRSYYRGHILIKRGINNIQVKDHELDGTKLRNL